MSKYKLTKWLGKKFQLVFYHGNSYDTIRKIRLNRLGLIASIFFILVLFFAIDSALIVYTPLKRLVPGYPNAETRRLVLENAIRLDSLSAEIDKRDKYLNAIRDLLINEVPIDEDFAVSPSILSKKQIKNFNNPIKPRERIEDYKNYIKISEKIPELFLPIEGIVISKYNPIQNHYGIDIARTGNDEVFAVHSGVIIISDYTIENGYTIVIQHNPGFISVYKHLNELFVHNGQKVFSGETIGKCGNTGEHTSGEHLHFELWEKGKSINPEDYLDF